MDDLFKSKILDGLPESDDYDVKKGFFIAGGRLRNAIGDGRLMNVQFGLLR